MTQKQVLAGAALVILTASISFLGIFSLGGEIRYLSLRVNYRYLAQLRQTPDFKAVFFQSSYDRNGIFTRDNILLLPYAWNTRYERIDPNLGMTEQEKEGEVFDKEMIFSDYQVTAEFIDGLRQDPINRLFDTYCNGL